MCRITARTRSPTPWRRSSSPSGSRIRTNAMVDQQIGLEETEDGIWAI
jgi:hypothetical protein